MSMFKFKRVYRQKLTRYLSKLLSVNILRAVSELKDSKLKVSEISVNTCSIVLPVQNIFEAKKKSF